MQAAGDVARVRGPGWTDGWHPSSKGSTETACPRTASPHPDMDLEADGPNLPWSHAAAAGLAAGVLMGLFIDGVMGKILIIGALWGVPTPAGGWTVHLANSLVFGLGFAALMRVTGTPAPSSLRSREGRRCLGLAAAYGVVLWVVAAGFVMPLWMEAVGLVAPPVPNLAPPSLVAHLIYGVGLAATIPFLARSGLGQGAEAGAEAGT